MAKNEKMNITKDDIRRLLMKGLAPVYQARVEIVNSIDSDYYQSATGEAELLNMALISSHVKKLPSTRDLKHIHDDYFSTTRFHEGKEKLRALLREKNWNIDFNQQSFRRLFHRFAEDAGVDDFYNAIERVEKERAPIDRFGNIKSWTEMKHSQVLSAPIPAYSFENDLRVVRKIDSLDVKSFCDLKNRENTGVRKSNIMMSTSVRAY